MRRVSLLLAVLAVGLVLASGVALAVEKTGNGEDNVIRGTSGPDTLSGGGDDRIYGLARRDRIHGDSGGDRLFGNTGRDELYGDHGFDAMFGDGSADFINAADERPGERVNCGAGTEDRAVIDSLDSGGFDNPQECETVYVVVAFEANGGNAGAVGPGENVTVEEAMALGLIEER